MSALCQMLKEYPLVFDITVQWEKVNLRIELVPIVYFTMEMDGHIGYEGCIIVKINQHSGKHLSVFYNQSASN